MLQCARNDLILVTFDLSFDLDGFIFLLVLAGRTFG